MRGLRSPADFIAVAEDTGLIVPIADWVLHEACRQAARWRRSLGDLAPRSVSVNLSARQASVPKLAEEVEAILGQWEIPPDMVCLELAEGALEQASASVEEHLISLKEIGVHLAIDDFGTGCSSLAHLRRFPVDSIKVDGAFVHGLGSDADDDAVVRAAIGLGRALGLTTVAEGVETAEQLDLLKKLDCSLAQGFYFARPQPGDEVEDLIRRSA